MKCLTSVIDILGTFKPQQMIDVIGYVADNKNPTLAHLQIIHTMPIHFIGKSDPITKHRQPRFNPGKQYVIGYVADNKSPTLAHLQIIHTMPIHFIGKVIR